MKKQIAILGGGPSAFLLAAFLDAKKFKITIYEKNKTQPFVSDVHPLEKDNKVVECTSMENIIKP